MGESVGTTKATNGAAALPKERQGRMRIKRTPELLEFSVDRAVAECWRKRRGIEKNIDVLRKTPDEIPAF